MAERLSLRDKVLLSLAESGRTLATSLATQAGLVEMWRVSRSHVSRTLEELKVGGLAVDGRQRIAGHPRAVNVYKLTGQGSAAAISAEQKLLAMRVPVLDETGLASEATFREAMARFPSPAPSLCQLLAQAEAAGQVDLRALRGSRRQAIAIKDLRQAPGTTGLGGRDREAASIAAWTQGIHPVLVVVGAAGIGKSVLLETVVQSLDDHHVVWFDARNRGAADLTQALHAFGRRGQGWAKTSDFEAAIASLKLRLGQLPLLVVIDSLDQAAPDLQGAVSRLAALAGPDNGLRLAVTARTPPSLPVPAQHVHLPALSPEGAVDLAVRSGVAPSQAAAVPTLVGTHPAFVRAWAQDVVEGNPGRALAAELLGHARAQDLPTLQWLALNPDGLPLRLLAAVVPDAERRIDALVTAGLCVGTHLRPRLPRMLADATLATIGRTLRQTMHEKVAQQALGTGMASDEYLYHLLEAGEKEQAVEWLSQNAHLVVDEAYRLLRAAAGTGPARR